MTCRCGGCRELADMVRRLRDFIDGYSGGTAVDVVADADRLLAAHGRKVAP